MLGDAEFGDWGWRLPFLAGLLLVLVGLYVRLRIAETPVFQKAMEQRRIARVPFSGLVRHQWRRVLLGAGAVTAPFTLFYIATTYCPAYGTTSLGIPRITMLFRTEFRYSGASAAYSLGGELGGAVPPLVATGMRANGPGVLAVGGYVSAMAVLSPVCLLVLPETGDSTLCGRNDRETGFRADNGGFGSLSPSRWRSPRSEGFSRLDD